MWTAICTKRQKHIRCSYPIIDTHSHILPGLDDGSCSLSEGLDFVRQAAGQGVTAIFATPHCQDGVFNCDKDAILSACRDLSVAVQKDNIDIQILPGAEIRVNHDLVEQYDAGRLLTLGNTETYLLLELPPMFIAKALFRMIRQLRNRGVTPIIAHAERNPMILSQMELADGFTAQGAGIQITAESLTGDFGRLSLKATRTFLENNQVFCLGSDMHPGRKYRMKAAAKKLHKWVGKQKTAELLWKNPERIRQQSGYGKYSPGLFEKGDLLKTGG